MTPEDSAEQDSRSFETDEPSPDEAGGDSTPSVPDSAPATDDTQNSPDDLSAELERLQSQAKDYLDGWQRARAEFANYKKRVDREMAEARQRAAADILVGYLSVADDLERALKDRPDSGEAASWAEGIELIHRKVKTILDSERVERIPAEGEMFDPTLHEALSHEESEEFEEGRIIDVIQQGYRLGDRVLRPALVRVAKQQD